MKVLLVAPLPSSPTSSTGGVAAASTALTLGMSSFTEVHYDVLVYEAPPSGISPAAWPHLRIIKEPVSTKGGRTHAAKVRARIRDLSRAGDYSVVHIQGPASFSTGARNELVTIHGISEVDSLYGLQRRSQKLRAHALRVRETRGRRRVANFVAVSGYAADFIRLSEGQCLWKIPNAVDPAFYTTALVPPPAKTVLFVGRVSQIKNIQGLIRSFASAWRQLPELRLRIVGGGTNTSYGRLCAQEAEQLPPGVVTFVGPCTTRDLQKELAGASMLVLFSWQENAPMVIAEAHACGLPVACSAVGGTAEMITSDDAGLVQPGDEMALAEALMAAATEQWSERRAKQIRSSAMKYHPKAVAKATLAAYQEVGASAGPRAPRGKS